MDQQAQGQQHERQQSVNIIPHGSGAATDPLQIFFKDSAGKTWVINVNGQGDNRDLHWKSRIEQLITLKTGVDKQDVYYTVNGKLWSSVTTIHSEDTVREHVRVRGGALNAEEVKAAFANLDSQIKALQAALADEQSKTLMLQQMMKKGDDSSSIIGAIRRGHMKDISPKKYINVQSSGSFKVWAKDVKEFIFWHDAKTKDLIEYFENKWIMDEKLDYANMKQCCIDKGLDTDVDAALHMVIGAFLEGESKVLADTAELTHPETVEGHKSGLELWRLLHYNFDRASAFNVIGLVEMIRNLQPAKNMQDVLPKVAALERLHQEYYKTALASKDPQFVKMREQGLSVYPEVFKKADLLKILPDAIVKELKKSTNMDFEKDGYSDIRDVVTTIVHNHMSTVTPMDVDKKFVMNIETNETAKFDEPKHEDDQREAAVNEEDCLYDEYGGFVCYIGKNSQGGWQQKGKAKGKGKGPCWNCGKHGHLSRDCWHEKGKGKGKGDAKGKSGHSYGKGQSYKGKGKGIHTFDSTAFVPQPQPISVQQQSNQSTLMSAHWNGCSSCPTNFGGLNLCSLSVKTKNRFEALADPEQSIRPARGSYTIGDAIQHAQRGPKRVARKCSLNGNRVLESTVADDRESNQTLTCASSPKASRRATARGRANTIKFGSIFSPAADISQQDCKNAKVDSLMVDARRGNSSTGRCASTNEKKDTDILACLIDQSANIAKGLNKLNVEDEDAYEMISMMVDSGASETVASDKEFASYPLTPTTATGTTYSSAAEKQFEDIVNIGEKVVETVDEHGNVNWAKFQICKGLSKGKILGSVSRLVQANHTVVFRDPAWGSYIENNLNGYRTYLRQENGSYYLDLWVRKASTFPRRGS